MSVALNVIVKDDNVKALFAELQKRMGDLTPAMRIIGEIVMASIQRNFDAGGRPHRWADLADFTKAARAKRKKWPGKILVVSGRLRSVYPSPERDRVTVGSNLKYALTHQFGAKKGQFGNVTAYVVAHVRRLASGKKANVKAHTRKAILPWGDIPARPFLMVQDEDWPEIGNVVMGFLMEATK